MTPWMDAIGKLRSWGYSFTVDEGKLKYACKGREPLLRMK